MRTEIARTPGGIEKQQLVQLKLRAEKETSLQGIFVMSFVEEKVSVRLDEGNENLNKLFSVSYLDDRQCEWHIFVQNLKDLSVLQLIQRKYQNILAQSVKSLRKTELQRKTGSKS